MRDAINARTNLGAEAFQFFKIPDVKFDYPVTAGWCAVPQPPAPPPAPPKPPVKVITPEFNEVEPVDIVLPPPEPPPGPPPAPPKPPDAESSGKMWALLALTAGAGLLLLKGKK
jgi:hypothetical protein